MSLPWGYLATLNALYDQAIKCFIFPAVVDIWVDYRGVEWERLL